MLAVTPAAALAAAAGLAAVAGLRPAAAAVLLRWQLQVFQTCHMQSQMAAGWWHLLPALGFGRPQLAAGY
jgi:hypothetical protein